SLEDTVICDLNKTLDLSQQPPQNCPKCGKPVDGHYCQGCALLRKKFKEDLFTYCEKMEFSKILPSHPMIIPTLLMLFKSHSLSNKTPIKIPHKVLHKSTTIVVTGAHYGYNCPPKVPIIPNLGPCKNQTIDEIPQIVPCFNPTCYSEDGNSSTYDSRSNFFDDSPNIFNPPPQPPMYSCEFCGNDAQDSLCYDDDDDEDYTIAFTHKEPDNSLSMGDEHRNTIPATESDEFIKSSVENLVLNPSESEGEHECDVPACEVFTTFSNILFDADYDFSSSDDQSFYDEDILKEIYSNPLFNEEIISMKIDPHHFDSESDLIESLLNPDYLIISSSSKIDSFLMSSPDSDSFMEEIDLSFTPDDPMPSGIEEDDYDSKRDILILEELLSNDSLSLPKNESFHFDIHLSSRPSAKPPNGNLGILNVKVMGGISEHKVPMPRLMITQPTFVPNQEKSPNLLSHQGHKASQPSIVLGYNYY
nr:hypothetical protein [Tanacetum cinerariifolium]